MIGTSHEFVPNNTIQGRDFLKKEVVNKSAANYSNEKTKLESTFFKDIETNHIQSRSKKISH